MHGRSGEGLIEWISMYFLVIEVFFPFQTATHYFFFFGGLVGRPSRDAPSVERHIFVIGIDGDGALTLG